MKIKKLSYKGFRGHNNEISLSDKTTKISGRNGEGKTIILDAFLFLLTGYDSEDRNNYNLFDTRKPISPNEHNEIMVSGTFDIDGSELVLERTVSMKWSINDKGENVRGTDVYGYSIDGNNVSAGAYKKYINDNICDGTFIKYIVNIMHYRNSSWMQLRSAICSMLPSDTPLLDKYPDISDKLKKDNADNIRKSFMSNVRKLNITKSVKASELKSFKDKQTNINTNLAKLKSELDSLKSERKELDNRIKTIYLENEEYVAKRKEEEDEIEAKRKEMEAARDSHEKAYRDKLDKLKQSFETAKENNKTLLSRQSTLSYEIEAERINVNSLRATLESLRSENRLLKTMVFKNECPVCGHEFSGAQLDEQRKIFKDKHDAALANNIREGKSVKSRLTDAEARLKSYEDEFALLENTDVMSIKKELNDWMKSYEPFDDSEYQSAISVMESKKTSIPKTDEIAQIQLRTSEINDSIETLTADIASYGNYDGDISRLESEISKINNDIVENMRLKSLVESYQRDFAALTSYVKDKYFDTLDIVMSEKNKSGEMEDCCKIYKDGVSGSNNTAAQIQIGIELSMAFQRYLGVTMPLFIDKAESINASNLPEYDGQLILLLVSENELKIERL